jgi:aminopeptidase N
MAMNTTMRGPRVRAGLTLLLLLAMPGWSLADATFDATTGRGTRQFPPDPQVRFDHIKLDLRMPRPQSRSFTCTETISFTTLGRAIAWLDLDAAELRISSVKDPAGGDLPYRYDDQRLTLQFPRELPANTAGGCIIQYECSNPKEGMIFALPDPAYKDRPLVIHTQGESQASRYWYVCHDSPNARFTSETIVTVPEKYLVVGNGKLVEKKDAGDGLAQYHYVMDRPHPAYLLSLVIGDLAVVSDDWRGKPVEYYLPSLLKDDARRTFGKTPRMIELFSNLTGVDYPYPKYSQSVVYLFDAGGMENISATTLTETAPFDARAALDGNEEDLISHELAHQWFGDMVTCKSWPHIWLNEGAATFMEEVWEEHERGEDEYTWRMWNTIHDVAESDKVDAAGGVVWPFYSDPEEVFSRSVSNPYPKGCLALHMLRRSLGDDLFWRCIHTYLTRYAWKDAETDDLRKVVDELSGQSYERWFYQWLYRPGTPAIRADYQWNQNAHAAQLTFEQTQKITEQAPVFDVDIDVWLVMSDGKIEKRSARMDSRTATLTVKCDAEPVQVCIDPQISLLAQWQLNLPQPMLLAELNGGPTIGARLQALRALHQKDSEDVRLAMKRIFVDDKAPQPLRREVATSLGTMQEDGARRILVEALAEGQAIADHKVRAAAVAALGEYRDADAAATLLRLARHDPTYTVEEEATRGLGRQAPTDAIVDVLLANAKKPAAGDRLRIVAVESLARLDDPRGVAPAMELAAYGQPFISRPHAIRALGTLGKAESARDKVRAFLIELIHDPQERSQSAALYALGELGDPKAIEPLRRFASGSAPPRLRDIARSSIDAINRHTGESASVSDLRSRVEKLEKDRESLEKRLDKLSTEQKGSSSGK